MEEEKLTIGFTLEDSYGNKFSSTSTSKIYTSLGDTDFDFIGEQLNTFLSQCGYPRYGDGTKILLKNLTENEYYALEDYLERLRKNSDKDNEKMEG